MDLRVFTAVLLAVVVIGLVVLAFVLFQPFLLAVLWGAVLAIVAYGPYEKLTARLKGYRSVASFLMTVAVLLLILAPFTALAIYFFEDVVQLAGDLEGPKLEARIQNFMDHPLVRKVRRLAEEHTGESIDHVRVATFFSESVLPPLLAALGQAVEFLFRLLLALAFVTLSIYFFFRDGRDLAQAVRELLPLSESDRDAVLGDLRGAVLAAVRGGFVVALVQGTLGFIIIFALGFERAVLWAGVMSLASLVPLVGTSLVWLPMASVLFVEGEVVKALVLIAYGLFVIVMADNVLRPILVGQHMEAHPLLLFFGTLGGIAAFGFAGIVLGPVVVALLNVASRLLRREFGTSFP